MMHKNDTNTSEIHGGFLEKPDRQETIDITELKAKRSAEYCRSLLVGMALLICSEETVNGAELPYQPQLRGDARKEREKNLQLVPQDLDENEAYFFDLICENRIESNILYLTSKNNSAVYYFSGNEQGWSQLYF